MAPSCRRSKGRLGRGDEDCSSRRGDRKARKPLVEKQRRARINESLQELRLILADAEVQSKLENAEVLELTVRRVQRVLRSRARGSDADTLLQREASERFAAGYIQCMHEVHSFVSACPAIDAALAAQLLNHLLESMPLSPAAPAPAPWPAPRRAAPSEETCSDAEEPEAEPGRTEPDLARTRPPAAATPKSMWRPW
ncbi:transcription cofactor HES-6 isoform X2 [Alligator mississippiensis]|uniref:transcription cofactor HES-6 isoform X2 n=1 Tax=Alligator mississippiensis TaxID=8496 RepID=UPI00287741B4|nr:transcription cofactor HES-6 isoform X2 [Alligator mississippiensis]